jgi:DNA-binding response OmpR family regulator
MPSVAAVVEDLLFLSRIREAARVARIDVVTARTPEALVAAVRAGASLVLVDADSQRLAWAEAIRSLRGEAVHAAVPVVAFLGHVNVDHAALARESGASRVLARSTFVAELPTLLREAAGPPIAGTEKDPTRETTP